jgi:hypothetical protein
MKLRARLSPRTGETEQLRLQLNEVLAEYVVVITALEKRLAAYEAAMPEMIYDNVNGILVEGAGCTLTRSDNTNTIVINVP